MNRDQIIAKTLVDMREYVIRVENRDPEGADGDETYIRDVYFSEMMKRLPEGEITTCDELLSDVECCPTCHGLYPHYEMYLVELPDDRAAWICCAVRTVLFPETAIAADDPEVLECMRLIFGDESGVLTERFTIYADRCIRKRPSVVSQIMKAMHLPSETEIKTDDHYRCFKCLGRSK